MVVGIIKVGKSANETYIHRTDKEIHNTSIYMLADKLWSQ